MKTTRHSSRLLTGFTIVIWLGALSSLVLAVAIGVRAGPAIGAMTGVIAAFLTVCALALVQIARAMWAIAANTAALSGRAERLEEIGEADEPEPEEEPVSLPGVVTRLEPRMRSEPPLQRPGAEPGVLRAVRT